ncbi:MULTISPECIES: DUF4810 domain-containing protein [Pseudoalteromonas]|jgi:hypothetical protein|uniref:DUF4810 domain-containing protein n=1 Tax=Pseudoalteromonas distincta TaxID=77608 RepID=A0A4P9IXW6_9GAMM|nr:MULTISPECIES: DUF4810 domain-containing protein [Pseudoalteromonas]KAA1163123.1 DUF4810 domain-containing protein [Pseudoalteromonas distincta]KHM49921.1 lipoprotein [Pseudoalteromonas elyakovii]KID40648.1 lipoprotein [Pseudoalteromonas distincta]MBA6410384.1 DUF4810 domain-containing protein [Pseudoalteromonas sp. 5Ae-yellow]MBB1276140.1 DUF4810 domain-containing protein [Pseudoalteromonas sp. SR43-3]|tara:strand:+ start:2069 stop:2416 length:348 start_codon:yes stop_codon:yes gene_type:complete
MKKLITLAFVCIALTGCNSTKEPIYYYGDYSTAVYAYLKADDVTAEEQISMLEQIIADAANKSKNVAPGLHAHLGMLYFETGNPSLGTTHFETEKSLFPESVHYIDFLLKSAKGA